ncbi:phage GP46 family protein [Halomonas saccharevitans]|uniref:Mu-like prophage protein gp46 n=1 Tax=Halomonas saccharevitans TaxID=416872 RepID=A0A1I7AFM5_9GAMM|nr:phage GP46 family protein [Halomonas saccharevitans]SFT73695.1 Mu-like prophage protein gp46 [Halomonas saccharevitans]
MDIALRYDPGAKRFDLRLEGGDLLADEGLETAVLLSLFTDRRALLEDRLPDGSSDRRGYWADAYRDRRHGSRLWLLHREKAEEDVRRRAREYAEEALAWLIEDGIAESVEVEARHVRFDTLGLRVVIRRGGRELLEGQYDYVWRNAA